MASTSITVSSAGADNSKRGVQGSSVIPAGSMDANSGKAGIYQTQGAHTMTESLAVPHPHASMNKSAPDTQ